jgi:uncharacterized protein (DUF2336 family)
MRWSYSALAGLLLMLPLAVGCDRSASHAQLAEQLQKLEAQPTAHEEAQAEAQSEAQKVEAQITANKPVIAAPSTQPVLEVNEQFVRVWTPREAAADALGRIGEASVPELIQVLSHPDPDVRVAAARALAMIGPKAEPAVPALTSLLNDSHDEVRRTVARALGQIGPAARQAVPALIKVLEEPAPHHSGSSAEP